MTRNLVTGGMGFLGSYVARQLLEDGEEVVIFQRRSKLPPSVADLEGKVEIFSGDISNWVHVVDAMKTCNIDCVYHVAAIRVLECERSAARGFEVNIVGTFNILEAARILGIKDVLYTSTTSVYGLTSQTFDSISHQITNDTPQKPEDMYTTAKVCCEKLLEQYHRQYGLNVRGVRPGMIVGAGRELSYYFGDWSGVIELPAKGQPYTVHSDPDCSCAYIYVKDSARSLIELKRAPESKLRQRIYNTHGFTATINEVVEAVKKYIPDAQINFEWDQSEYMKEKNQAINYDIDISVSSEDFGYQPKYLLDGMVKDFIDEVRARKAG